MGLLKGSEKYLFLLVKKDILVADARKLKSIAESMGIEINYYEYADMVHVWMLLNFPESKKAKQQIIDLVLH